MKNTMVSVLILYENLNEIEYDPDLIFFLFLLVTTFVNFPLVRINRLQLT